ncbi:phage tail protein [Alkalihalobacillus sp. LMS39]|uniref:phage tail protein n=1 Tax=Alkalihalobacillus sp. LMS39 TaxID=2924032 RepID=UPI001FB2962D|nr:phage tail protein [Alkalihalobacillus sp. LMS39]UOE96076.1 phage tail protein [Alkalihalobacillus sp. LMS39]
MPTVVENFDAMAIKNSSVQFFDNGTQKEGTKFGCVGNLGGETTLKEIIKRCEGVEVRKITKPEKIDLTVSAHIPVKVVRDIFGINSTDLKPGVYKYSQNSKGKEFVFTADVIDEFEDVVKLIAFPKCSSATGFRFTIENGADEVAEMEVEITAYPDEKKNLYYEAFASELQDTNIQENWHKLFTYELVEKIPTP